MINKRNLALAVCVFICGWILGSNNRPVPLITSSVGGASYEEGYQTTAGDKLAAVKKTCSNWYNSHCKSRRFYSVGR